MDGPLPIFDASLIVTVVFIFALTLLGAYLRSTRRDTCLRSFERYHVTIERANGKIVWGVLELESTGLELRYRDSVQDANHVESSYVLYGVEFGDIQAIYRYVDDLTEEDRRRRQRELERYFHPGPLVRLWRGVQHFFSLAGDSMAEVLGLLLGTLRRPAGRYITDASDTHLKRFSSTVVGTVGGTIDPLLERLIGQKVVFDLIEGEEVHEHVGILKNYSPDFLELLDVQFPQKQAMGLEKSQSVALKSMTAAYENGVLRVANQGEHPLLLQSLRLGDEEELLNVVVDGGETVELHPEERFANAELNVRVVRELDMIIPRKRCLVRHRAERYEPQVLPEIIFDLGVLLSGSSMTDAREARLRRQLEQDPDQALAASNLGAILVQKQQYAEAQQWLEKAYAARFSLPDNGRRTLMLLHELRRKQAKGPDHAGRLAVQQSAASAHPAAWPPGTAAPAASAITSGSVNAATGPIKAL
jgi:hypothetical protein